MEVQQGGGRRGGSSLGADPSLLSLPLLLPPLRRAPGSVAAAAGEEGEGEAKATPPGLASIAALAAAAAFGVLHLGPPSGPARGGRGVSSTLTHTHPELQQRPAQLAGPPSGAPPKKTWSRAEVFPPDF